jgi:MshEN domain
MNHIALRRDAAPSYGHFHARDEPVEFGIGLRARLEGAGLIDADDAATERLALERKLLAACPELADVRIEPVRRRRVPHLPFATLVYQANLLPAESLEDALEEAERRSEPVGRVLTRARLLREDEVVWVLAEQRGLAFVRLGRLELDGRLTGLLPHRTALDLSAVPLGYLRQLPVVAVSDPTDDAGRERIAAQLGEVAMFVASPREDVVDALRRLYGPAEAAA